MFFRLRVFEFVISIVLFFFSFLKVVLCCAVLCCAVLDVDLWIMMVKNDIFIITNPSKLIRIVTAQLFIDIFLFYLFYFPFQLQNKSLYILNRVLVFPFFIVWWNFATHCFFFLANSNGLVVDRVNVLLFNRQLFKRNNVDCISINKMLFEMIL